MKRGERRELDHRLDLAFEQHRQHDHVLRARRHQTGPDADGIVRHVGEQDPLPLQRALPDQALAEPVPARLAGLRRVGVAGQLPQARRPVRFVLDVHHALLRVDERRELREQHLRDRVQVALALHHAAELREVRLQPVLLGVALGSPAEVADHRVDVVLELRHLAARVHLDRPREVALGDRGGDLGDRTHLRREVRGEQVHVVGEVLPGAGDAGHLRLAAELAVGADLARDPRHLGGERVELVDHRVEGVLQLQDLALDVDRDLAREVAVGDGGGDLGDVAHLRREVRRHRVHVVGQVLPHPAHALDLGLAAELAVGADLARDARHLGGERVELVDHRVDGLLDLQDLAAHVDRDLARQVAAGDRGRHLGDVAHLRGEVGRHRVDRVGQVLPRAGDARHDPPGRRACPRCRPRARRASPRRRSRSAGRPSC